MPTVDTKTVKSSGGNYTTAVAAEAGEQGDFVSLDIVKKIELYASAKGSDSSQLNIDGSTTDATRYWIWTCPPGERHAGVWDTNKHYFEFSYSASGGGIIRNQDDFTVLEFLQVRNTNGSAAEFNNCIYCDNKVTINSCITRGGYQGLSALTNPSTVRNCLCYGAVAVGAYVSTSGASPSSIENCTLIGGTAGLSFSSSVVYGFAKNVYAHGGTRGIGSSASGGGMPGGVVTKTNVTTSDTTATGNSGGGGATNCTNSIAHDTSNFTNVTSGSEDYRLPVGSALIDDGVDLSGTFTLDIAGNTRGATFDVGAFEYVAGGSITADVPAGVITFSSISPNCVKRAAVVAGSCTLTGVAPGTRKLAAVPPGSLACTGVAPTTKKTAAVSPGTCTITGIAPTIARAAAVPPGSLAFEGLAPAVRKLFSVPVGTITIAGVAPTAETENPAVASTRARATYSLQFATQSQYTPGIKVAQEKPSGLRQ